MNIDVPFSFFLEKCEHFLSCGETLLGFPWSKLWKYMDTLIPTSEFIFLEIERERAHYLTTSKGCEGCGQQSCPSNN